MSIQSNIPESRIIANNILWNIFIENLVHQKFTIPPRALKVEPKYLSTFSKNLNTNKLELCYKCSGKILVRDIVYIHYTGKGFKPICPNCDNYDFSKKIKKSKNIKNNQESILSFSQDQVIPQLKDSIKTDINFELESSESLD